MNPKLFAGLSLRVVTCNTYDGRVYLISPHAMDETAGIVDRIHPQSCAKFATRVEDKVNGGSKLNDSPDIKMFMKEGKFMQISHNISDKSLSKLTWNY